MGIESRRGLVDQQDRRVVDERQGERQPLPLATGELPRSSLRLGSQAEAVEKGADRCSIGIPFVEGGVERDRLPKPQGWEERRVLELHPEEAFRGLASGGVATDADATRRGPPQTLDAGERGRLAGAVRAEEAVSLTNAHRQGEGLDHPVPAVGDA